MRNFENDVARPEADRDALVAHLNAKSQVDGTALNEEIAPSGDVSGQPTAPLTGDARFYKKMYATPSHDVLVHVGDCGCNNWQAAHAADKAHKGIAKLEYGRTDWRSMQHCASCTGGGMWKVRW